MMQLANWLVLAGWVWWMPAWAGSAALLDAIQIKGMLKKDQPCCVVDARAEARRKLHPIGFAVVYSDTIKPKAGAYAVVIGDSDGQSLEIAQTIAIRSGQDVYAIKGGYATWQQVEPGDKKISSGTSTNMPQSFTIPSNTCEQGPALQEYK